jgi:hypothetical protein
VEYLSDIILALAAFAVAIYCFVLSGRLKRFATLENGMGSAIAVLSVQVDELTKAMEAARGAATGSASRLEVLNTRAEAAAARLELMLASLHDMPDGPSAPAEPNRRLRVVRRRSSREIEAAE